MKHMLNLLSCMFVLKETLWWSRLAYKIKCNTLSKKTTNVKS